MIGHCFLEFLDLPLARVSHLKIEYQHFTWEPYLQVIEQGRMLQVAARQSLFHHIALAIVLDTITTAGLPVYKSALMMCPNSCRSHNKILWETCIVTLGGKSKSHLIWAHLLSFMQDLPENHMLTWRAITIVDIIIMSSFQLRQVDSHSVQPKS